MEPRATFQPSQFRVAGYSGHCPGTRNVIGCTPVARQLHACANNGLPVGETNVSWIEATQSLQPLGATPNLWPFLQSTAAQGSAKPEYVSVQLGDTRMAPFRSSYDGNFKAPIPGTEQLRSPLRNRELVMGAVDLSSMYRSALTRIGSHRIVEIHESMAGRLWSKLSNRGDCAFRLRQLFRKHDLTNSGRISIENFRVATEEFGMQLDDDALLALFSQYDTQCTGYIPYHQLMQNLLDKDDYLKYASGQS